MIIRERVATSVKGMIAHRGGTTVNSSPIPVFVRLGEHGVYVFLKSGNEPARKANGGVSSNFSNMSFRFALNAFLKAVIIRKEVERQLQL